MGYVSRLLAAALVALFALHAGGANAAKRVALVVGNGHYAHIGSLGNSLNDAEDMAAKLRGIGFEVVAGTDLTADGFKSIIKDFLEKLRGSELALFYYAGHGMQADNVNYVLPVDVELKSAADVLFDAVSVQDIVRFMENEATTTVVLLDSCRDNPFLNASMGSGTRGVYLYSSFVPQSGASGTYIAFAAQPGQVSYDGDGRNSPFTGALLQHIADKDVDIRIMMSDVRREVIAATNDRQVPWENSALVGRLLLNPSADAGSPDDRAARRERFRAERAAWEKIVASSNEDDFTDFLSNYPDGIFASTAREQLRRLGPRPPQEIVPTLAIVPAGRQPIAASPIQQPAKVVPATETASKAPVADQAVNGTPADTPALAPVARSERTAPAQSAELKIQPANGTPAARLSQEGAVVVRGTEIEEQPPESVAAARPGSLKLAALDPLATYDPAKPEAFKLPPMLVDQTAIIRGIQRELVRLGCLEGKADGIWGPLSKAALDRYVMNRPTHMADFDPDKNVLNLLRGEESRVCPDRCPAGETMLTGACIAKWCGAGEILGRSGQCEHVARVHRQSAHRSSAESSNQNGSRCFVFDGQRICD